MHFNIHTWLPFFQFPDRMKTESSIGILSGESKKGKPTRNKKSINFQQDSPFAIQSRNILSFYFSILRSPFCLYARNSCRCTLVWALQGSMRPQTGYFIFNIDDLRDPLPPFSVSFMYFSTPPTYISLFSFFWSFFRHFIFPASPFAYSIAYYSISDMKYSSANIKISQTMPSNSHTVDLIKKVHTTLINQTQQRNVPNSDLNVP